MFEYEYDLEGKTPLHIPVILSVDDQAFLSRLADLIESHGVGSEESLGIGGGPSSRISKEVLSAIRSVAIDKGAGLPLTVELGTGMGAHLRDLLVEGLHLVPEKGWYEKAETADAIAAKMILAYGSAMSGSAQSGDHEEMKNVYRAGLGLPVVLEQLKVDQCAIAAREAVSFAEVVGLKIQVGDTPLASEERGVLVLDVASALEKLYDSDPNIYFVDMKTGGRPNGQAGSVGISRAGTFFGNYEVTFGRDRITTWGHRDAITLREALFKAGKQRLAVLNDRSVRNEVIPYARYISRALARNQGHKIADLIADLTRSDPATPMKKLLTRAMKAPDPSTAFAQEAKAADNEYVAEFSRVLSLATSPTTPLAEAERLLNDFADEMIKVRNSIG